MKKKNKAFAGGEPGTIFIPGVGVPSSPALVDSREAKRIAAFCKHPKWSRVLQDITESVSAYECAKGKLSESILDAFPLEVGRFFVHVSYRDVRRCVLSTKEYQIYTFGYKLETLPEEEQPAEVEPKPPKKTFYGATGEDKRAELGLVTRVYTVDWKRLFAIEEFSREIKALLRELEASVQEKQAEDAEAATGFGEYLDGASELLEEV